MIAIDLLALAGLVSVPASVGLGLALWKTRMELRVRRELFRALADSVEHAPTAADARRLEQAVEAMALDVERLAESQRFTARLLADRDTTLRLAERSQRTPADASRVNTPH